MSHQPEQDKAGEMNILPHPAVSILLLVRIITFSPYTSTEGTKESQGR